MNGATLPHKPSSTFLAKILVCLVTTLCQVSCGGETAGGSSSCESAAACGGDITGVWRLTSFCLQLEPGVLSGADGGAGFPSACNSALTDAVNTAQSTPIDATIEFGTDGQYREAGTMRVAETVTYSAECLRALGVSSDPSAFCAQLESTFRRTFDSSSCTTSGGGCHCSISGITNFDQTGPYRTNGNQIFMDNDTQGGPYCVQGSTAEFSPGTPGVSGRIALKR
jgi:hypothetical protein